MSKYIQHVTLGLVAVLVVVSLVGGDSQSVAVGGDTNFDSLDTTDGYKVDGTVVIDGDGNIDAPITSSTGTFTGDLSADSPTFFVDASENEVGIGTTTAATQFHIEGEDGAGTVATGTISVSSASSTPSVGGRLILEDSDGAGCSEIYALNGTLTTASVTCPTGI